MAAAARTPHGDCTQLSSNNAAHRTQKIVRRSPRCLTGDWLEGQHRKARGCSQETICHRSARRSQAGSRHRSRRGISSGQWASRGAPISRTSSKATGGGCTTTYAVQNTGEFPRRFFGMTWLVLSAEQHSPSRRKAAFQSAKTARQIENPLRQFGGAYSCGEGEIRGVCRLIVVSVALIRFVRSRRGACLPLRARAQVG